MLDHISCDQAFKALTSKRRPGLGQTFGKLFVLSYLIVLTNHLYLFVQNPVKYMVVKTSPSL